MERRSHREGFLLVLEVEAVRLTVPADDDAKRVLMPQ